MEIVRHIMLLCSLLFLSSANAQEETTTIYQGKRYLDLNIRSIQKSNQQISKQQTRLLHKLKKKESRYAKKLKNRDSAAYARFQQQPLTYDSIGKLSKANPASLKGRTDGKIDSLKKIEGFLQNKVPLVTANNEDLEGYDNKLNTLNQQTSYRNYISDLIDKRTKNLKAINGSAKGKIGGFTSIEKNAFYGREKIKVFKQVADEPSKAEDKALEWLQGQNGFDKALKDNNGMAGLSKDASTADLEKMGVQTKRQMAERLQNRFGKGGMPNVQQSMSKQIDEFNDKTKSIKSTVNSAKQSRQSLKPVRKIEKPSFKINPMRALPFWKRIEKEYSWQTTRASINGSQPAMLQLAATAGFKHTPRLSYGLGISTSIGLGQGWSNVRFSFEGVGLRTYVQYKWEYGIGAYAGYERTYKHAAFFDRKETISLAAENEHNTKLYNEAILVGLTKSYRINDKWNGSIQLLYDLWWKEKGMRSPVIIRFATQKN